jgi:hypothetical protein
LILISETPMTRGAWPISLQAQMKRREVQILKQRSAL